MGDTALAKGLFPLDQPSLGPSSTFQSAWFWAMLRCHAHRFAGRPIAEVLVFWTTILLLDGGARPTIGDIAKASGVPRPTVSRYIDRTIQRGWVEERVNPRDRRRRELHLAEKGVKELEAMIVFFHEMYPSIVAVQGEHSDHSGGQNLQENLEKVSKHIAATLK